MEAVLKEEALETKTRLVNEFSQGIGYGNKGVAGDVDRLQELMSGRLVKRLGAFSIIGIGDGMDQAMKHGTTGGDLCGERQNVRIPFHIANIDFRIRSDELTDRTFQCLGLYGINYIRAFVLQPLRDLKSH